MKKFLPMAVVAACVASVAFASVRQPAATVNTQQQAAVDTVIPQDTTQPAQDTVAPEQDTTTMPEQDTTAPVDTSSTTDTSSVGH